MSAPGQWLTDLLAQEDAHQFALKECCKTKRGSKPHKRWLELLVAIDVRRRESLRWFREECGQNPRIWDGCDAWFEVRQ